MASGEDLFHDLERATVAFKHLNSNSAIHSDPFSAIAEFVDNSYDAQAKNLLIDYSDRDGFHLLEFLDDGKGMSHEEALAVIAFGHSSKDQEQIGHYGNGLKSGGFHLGGELLLLTKKDGVRTVMLISHKFHEEKNLETSVFVPCPSMDEYGRPYGTQKEKERFDMEMRIIKEYAPLGSMTLDELFNRITTPSGTLVIISRLRRTPLGEFLINVTRDQHDILLDGDDLPNHKTSLKEYLSILYLYPRMRIQLRGKVVNPKKICANWLAKYLAEIPTSKFKDAFSNNAKERQDKVENLEQKLNMINSELGEVNSKKLSLSDQKSHRQPLLNRREAVKKQLEEAKKESKDYKNNFKEEKIALNCGIEMKDRANNGIHFYINNRLIEWGYKKAFFKKNELSFGVSAYIDLKSSLFRPTTNKQGFECAKTFNTLVRSCDENLTEYFNYFQNCWLPKYMKTLGMDVQDIKEEMESFWKANGYRTPLSASSIRVPEEQMSRKQCGIWFLCQRCRWWKIDNRPQQPSVIPETVTCQSRNQGCTEQLGKTFREGFEKKENWKKVEFKRNNAVPLSSRPREAAPPPISIRQIEVISEPSTSIIPIVTTSSRILPMDPVRSSSMAVESSSRRRPKAPIESNPPRRVIVESESDFEVEKDVEVVPEDVEAEDIPVIEYPERPQARRPAVKAKRRLREETDSDGSKSPVKRTPPKKTRNSTRARRTGVPQPAVNREQYLEEKLNGLLKALGAEQIPKDGRREFDPDQLVRDHDEEVRLELEASNERVLTLTEFLRKIPNFPLNVPNNIDNGKEMLDTLITQIRQMKRYPRRQLNNSVSLSH